MSISSSSLLGLGNSTLGAPTAPTPTPSFSNFTNTGIASLSGGYAYPPGSDMVKFMDNINNTVASAGMGPNGGSVVDWANGLAIQAQQRQALAAQQAATSASTMLGSAGVTGSGGATSITQIFQMLMTLMASMQSGTTTAA